MTGEDGETRAEHDPLAEEADLLTRREARARIVEELREVRRRLESPQGEPSAGDEPSRLRERLEVLERAAARMVSE